MSREASIVDAIMRALRAQGCYVEKVHGSPFGLRGSADLVVCVPLLDNQERAIPGSGRYLRLEVKRPGQRPDGLQRLRLQAVHQHGGYARVVTSVAEALAVLAAVQNDAVPGPPHY